MYRALFRRVCVTIYLGSSKFVFVVCFENSISGKREIFNARKYSRAITLFYCEYLEFSTLTISRIVLVIECRSNDSVLQSQSIIMKH